MGNNLQSASGGRPQNRSMGSYHASGPGKVIAVLYGVFTLSAGARAGYQLVRKFDEAPLAILLSLLSAVIYAVAAVALARRGERARRVALVTISAELAGVLGVVSGCPAPVPAGLGVVAFWAGVWVYSAGFARCGPVVAVPLQACLVAG